MFDRTTWTFINSFADWFAAAGTIAAVVVALYFARQDKRVRLSIFAGVRVLVSQGQNATLPEYVTIGITNIGHREAQITAIGWRVGLFKKRLSIQTVMRDGMSSPLPVRLRDGEEARYYIPLAGAPDWLEDFVGKFLAPDPKTTVKHLHVCVYTSVGRVFRVRVEESLREKLSQSGHRGAAL